MQSEGPPDEWHMVIRHEVPGDFQLPAALVGHGGSQDLIVERKCAAYRNDISRAITYGYRLSLFAVGALIFFLAGAMAVLAIFLTIMHRNDIASVFGHAGTKLRTAAQNVERSYRDETDKPQN